MSRELVDLDLSNPDHRVLFFDLLYENADKFLNDHLNDIIFIINESSRLMQAGNGFGHVLLVDGVQIGVCWFEVDLYGIGYIHGAIKKPYRNLYNTVWFLKKAISNAFNGKIRKLVSQVPTYNKAAEVVLRKAGFKKEGILKDAFTVGGAPQKLLLLGLTKTEYERALGDG